MGIAAMRHLLVHKIGRQAVTGKDEFTNPTHSSTKESYPARVEPERRLIRTAQGQEVESHTRVLVDTGQGENAVIFNEKDLITLPSEFWPVAAKPPAVLSVKPQVGSHGVDHLEIFL